MVAHFTLRAYDVSKVFFRKKFDDSFDVTKCLQQIEMPDLLHIGNNKEASVRALPDPDPTLEKKKGPASGSILIIGTGSMAMDLLIKS